MKGIQQILTAMLQFQQQGLSTDLGLWALVRHDVVGILSARDCQAVLEKVEAFHDLLFILDTCQRLLVLQLHHSCLLDIGEVEVTCPGVPFIASIFVQVSLANSQTIRT